MVKISLLGTGSSEGEQAIIPDPSYGGYNLGWVGWTWVQTLALPVS